MLPPRLTGEAQINQTWNYNKYLKRSAVGVAGLWLGSTSAHLSLSVKSSRLVPCMRTREKRLHEGWSGKEDNSSPQLPASPSRADRGSATVHDVSGNVGKGSALVIG